MLQFFVAAEKQKYLYNICSNLQLKLLKPLEWFLHHGSVAVCEGQMQYFFKYVTLT